MGGREPEFRYVWTCVHVYAIVPGGSGTGLRLALLTGDAAPGVGYRWPSGLRGVISSNLVFARVSDNPRQAVLLE